MQWSWRSAIADIGLVVIVSLAFLMPNVTSTASGVGTTTSTPAASPDVIPDRPTSGGSLTPTLTATAPSSFSCDFRDELDRVRSAVVLVLVQYANGQSVQGSAFHIGGGKFVTAAHVVLDDNGVQAATIELVPAETGAPQSAAIVAVGESQQGNSWGRDLAVLKSAPIAGELEQRAPSESDVDAVVRAVGYPWSQERPAGSLPEPLVVRGGLLSVAVVSGIEVVQSSAPTQQGMSGGPLVDECGNAIAVTSGARVRPGDSGNLQEGFPVFVSVSELDRLQ